jgi:hypothetical protein
MAIEAHHHVHVHQRSLEQGVLEFIAQCSLQNPHHSHQQPSVQSSSKGAFPIVKLTAAHPLLLPWHEQIAVLTVSAASPRLSTMLGTGPEHD